MMTIKIPVEITVVCRCGKELEADWDEKYAECTVKPCACVGGENCNFCCEGCLEREREC